MVINSSLPNTFINHLENKKDSKEIIAMEYSVAIRTLGKAGAKYQTLLDSLMNQTIKPSEIIVYIAEGYTIPKETIGLERYVYVKKGMVSQRALQYTEIKTEYILFLDDDVYLPPDGVEKLFLAKNKMNANVVSPDVFPNSERSCLGKLIMALSGRMFPRRDDKEWAYKVMRNAGYSYNNSPSQDIYFSQTNAGPCFLCSKADFIKIRFQEELWLEKCPYPLGEDQVMYYKMFCLGLKQLTVFNSGITHLDAGTTLMSEDREKSLIYSDLYFKTIFWHRFIYLPERCKLLKIWDCLCIICTIIIMLIISLLKGRINIVRVKYSAIKDGISFLLSNEYKKLPKISKI